MTDHTTPRGPLGILGDRLAGDDGQPAALSPAETLEHLTDLAGNVETLACKIGTYGRTLAYLGEALDNPERRQLCTLVYAGHQTMESLERDADAVVASLYAIIRAAKGGAL